MTHRSYRQSNGIKEEPVKHITPPVGTRDSKG